MPVLQDPRENCRLFFFFHLLFILYFYFCISFFSSLFLLSFSPSFVPFSTLLSRLLRVLLYISFSVTACFTLNFYHLNVSYTFFQTSRTFSIELRLFSFVFGDRRVCYWKFCSYLRYVQVAVPYRKRPIGSPLVLSLS